MTLDPQWTIAQITCPRCGFSWTDHHASGTLITECPDCDNQVETLTDTDEIREIEQAVRRENPARIRAARAAERKKKR